MTGFSSFSSCLIAEPFSRTAIFAGVFPGRLMQDEDIGEGRMAREKELQDQELGEASLRAGP